MLYFPIFYSLKMMIGHNVPIQEAVPLGLAAYKKNWYEDVTAIWKVWIPAQTFNFAFSPMWFRVPFVAIVSFGWTCFVSIRRGKPEPEDELALIIHESSRPSQEDDDLAIK